MPQADVIHMTAAVASKAAREEIERLRNQIAVAKSIVSAGVNLMTKEQIGEWRGVRSFLEQETADYEPFAERPNA